MAGAIDWGDRAPQPDPTAGVLVRSVARVVADAGGKPGGEVNVLLLGPLHVVEVHPLDQGAKPHLAAACPWCPGRTKVRAYLAARFRRRAPQLRGAAPIGATHEAFVRELFILELPGEAAAALNDRETRGLVVTVRKLGPQPWAPVQVREVGPHDGEVPDDFDIKPALYRLWRMMPPRPAADDHPDVIRFQKEA